MTSLEFFIIISSTVSFGILMFFAGSFVQWKREKDRVDKIINNLLN